MGAIVKWGTRLSIALGLAALCWLASPQPVGSQAPPLTATWHNTRLVVIWQAQEAVCVWLVGGGRLDKPLPVQCAASGTAELSTGGTDQDYSPLARTIELRNANSQTVASLTVPIRNQVILPLIAR